MEPEPGSNEEQQSLATQGKKESQIEEPNIPMEGELKHADTEMTTILGEDEPNTQEDDRGHSKETISPRKASKAPLETTASESDTQSTSPKSEMKITDKKQIKVEREFFETVMKRKETVKALLVSSEIFLEEEETPEEEVEEETLPEPGHSHFKFLKKRCGKLINIKTWVAPWQGYNILETAKSWKPVEEWAPTRQFIRYQNNLVVWRHNHPLAQHIGWERGCIKKYCKRPMISSSWDN